MGKTLNYNAEVKYITLEIRNKIISIYRFTKFLIYLRFLNKSPITNLHVHLTKSKLDGTNPYNIGLGHDE